MTWQNILKREKYQPKNASSLAIIYLEDELNNTFKDINFSEVIKESLDPEIKYLSHLRR
mgnify:CR=1 FL=1